MALERINEGTKDIIETRARLKADLSDADELANRGELAAISPELFPTLSSEKLFNLRLKALGNALRMQRDNSRITATPVETLHDMVSHVSFAEAQIGAVQDTHSIERGARLGKLRQSLVDQLEIFEVAREIDEKPDKNTVSLEDIITVYGDFPWIDNPLPKPELVVRVSMALSRAISERHNVISTGERGGISLGATAESPVSVERLTQEIRYLRNAQNDFVTRYMGSDKELHSASDNGTRG